MPRGPSRVASLPSDDNDVLAMEDGVAYSFVWGRGFRLVESLTPTGRTVLELEGIDGGHEPISWSSFRDLREFCAAMGVPLDAWPAYPDCDVDSEVPLDDVAIRSDGLRHMLVSLPSEAADGNFWLQLIRRLLKDGHQFFIVP